MATIAELSVDINANLDGLRKGLAEANSRLEGLEKNVNSSGGKMNNTFSSLGKSIVGAFSVGAVIAFGKEIIDITGQFQKLQAVLNNSLGSESEGQIAFAQIQDFAAKTNFSVLELTGSFTALANRGIRPTATNLTSLADVANALGKPLDDVVQAVLDVTNTERWNELGIKVAKAGDQITATFRGQTVTAKATEQGALDLVTAIGKFEGVAGSTAAISQTLTGATSNLGDAMNQLFATIGGKGSQVITEFIQGLTTTAQAISRLLASSEELKQQGFLKSLGEEGDKVKERIDALTASNEKLGIANARNAAINQLLADATANLTQLEADRVANLERASEVLEKDKAVLRDKDAEISNGILLEKKRIEVLNQLTTGTYDTTTATVGLTAAVKDQKNSLELVNEQLEKYYGILGNPDSTNKAVADGAKRIRSLEIERDRLQEVIDARVKALVPQNLQNLSPIPQGQQSLKGGIGDASGLKEISTAAIDAQKNLATLQTGFQDFEAAFLQAGGVIIDMAPAITSGIVGMAEGIGEGIAAAISGVSEFGSFFDVIIQQVAQFGKTLGGLLIAQGVAAVAAKALINNPYTAIIGGIALIAASQAALALFRNAPGGKVSAPPLATGTNYMPSDGLAYLHQGEAVVPKKYNPYLTGNGGGMGGEVIFTIYGDTLKGVLTNNDRRRDRTG